MHNFYIAYLNQDFIESIFNFRKITCNSIMYVFWAKKIFLLVILQNVMLTKNRIHNIFTGV